MGMEMQCWCGYCSGKKPSESKVGSKNVEVSGPSQQRELSRVALDKQAAWKEQEWGRELTRRRLCEQQRILVKSVSLIP